MDSRARSAFDDAMRRLVDPVLDELAVEVDQLRRQVALLERCAGLSSDRMSLEERRRAVAELRERGLSSRTIAAAVGVHRVTVLHDYRALGLGTPAATLGADGVVRRHRAAVGSARPVRQLLAVDNCLE